MSKFPIIFGIIGKKLYLTLLLALIFSLDDIPKLFESRKNIISEINILGGSLFEILSIFIPCLFKFKSKSEICSSKSVKFKFKNYLILFLITLLFFGINKLIEYLRIRKYHPIDVLWISPCINMICYFLLSIKILKTKYYIHNIISLILFCIFSIINDIILEKFTDFDRIKLLSLISDLVNNLLFCYIKYLIDKKYHSHWDILFFLGLFQFIINSIYFIIIIIIDPYNNLVFKAIRSGENKYIIPYFFIYSFFVEFLGTLLKLLILEYFSFNHVFISQVLFRIIFNFVLCISPYKIFHWFFLIVAFLQILSLLFYLEILEFNFCNLNRNTKRNIMLREEEEMILRNNTNTSEIEIDDDLIVKNPEEKKELELYNITEESEGKIDNNEN